MAAAAVTPTPTPAPAKGRQPSVTGQLVKLNFTLARRQLARSPWQIVGMVVGLLYLLAAGAGLFFGMSVLMKSSLPIHADVPVVVFGLITLAWMMLGLLFFGVDQTLDPARFSLFPLRARDMLPGLTIIGLLDVGSLACLLGAIGLAVGWVSSPLVAAIAAVAGILGTLVGMLGTRVLTTGLASMLSSRKFKDAAAVIVFLLIMAFSVGMQFVGVGTSSSRNVDAMLTLLHGSATVLSWTPFGFAWALPGDAAAGAWGIFAVHAVLALASVAVLWWAWGKLLDRALTSPLETGSGSGTVKVNSWVDRVFPATPAGAIGARTARYYRRDSRHMIGLISLVVMPFLMLVPVLIRRENFDSAQYSLTMIAFTPAISAAFVAMSLMAELSYDGSAISTHMLTGIRGRDDRLGRVYGTLLVIVPLLTVMLLVGAAVSRRGDLVPGILGLTVSLAATGMGAGLVMDTLVNYPYPPPGSNPFAKNNGGGFAGFLGFFAMFIVAGVGSAPASALVIAQLVTHQMMWGWIGLLAGVVVGPLVFWGLLTLASKNLDKRWPEVLKNVTSEKN